MHLKQGKYPNSYLQNFNIKSVSSGLLKNQKSSGIQQEVPIETKLQSKCFLINGVNYYQNQTLVTQQAQLIEDSFSVKGDYFYLKKGDNVHIRYIIGEVAEVNFMNNVGYFPIKSFRLLQYSQ